MALFGSLSTLRAQVASSARFEAAFAYLADCLRPGTAANKRLMAVGMGETARVELAAGAFALEQVYMSKPRSEGFFESHRAYIDVQFLVEGEELIEVADIGKLRVKEDKTPAKDVIIYETYAQAATLRLGPNEGAIFFPVDGHMPSLAIGTPVRVRKTVIKVPVA